MVQARHRNLGTSAFQWYLRPGERLRSEKEYYVDTVQERSRTKISGTSIFRGWEYEGEPAKETCSEWPVE